MFLRDFGKGATYFWQVAERGGHLFLARKKIEKARETHFFTHFLRDFWEGATYFWQVAERGGHLFLASRWEGGPLIFGSFEKQNLRPPPPTNNEPSLITKRSAYIMHMVFSPLWIIYCTVWGNLHNLRAGVRHIAEIVIILAYHLICAIKKIMYPFFNQGFQKYWQFKIFRPLLKTSLNFFAPLCNTSEIFRPTPKT